MISHKEAAKPFRSLLVVLRQKEKHAVRCKTNPEIPFWDRPLSSFDHGFLRRSCGNSIGWTAPTWQRNLKPLAIEKPGFVGDKLDAPGGKSYSAILLKVSRVVIEGGFPIEPVENESRNYRKAKKGNGGGGT